MRDAQQMRQTCRWRGKGGYPIVRMTSSSSNEDIEVATSKAR